MRPRTIALSSLPEGECSSEELKPPSFQIDPKNARKESSWPEP